jgi:hypothetical protein
MAAGPIAQRQLEHPFYGFTDKSPQSWLHADLAAGIPESLVCAHEDSCFFDFADDAGEPMCAVPVCDGFEVIDWVAWRRKRPQRWWVRSGEAIITAPWVWRQAVDWYLPLHLVATPQEWVSDARGRTCILQLDKFDLYQLQRVPLIECSEQLEAYLSAEILRRTMERLNFGRPASCQRSRAG